MQIRVTKPIAEIQTDNYNKLTSDLYLFITKTSDFPEWKQANYADTWANLSIKQLATTLTTAETVQLTYINSIRDWKNTLLSERDRVKALIFTATDVKTIRDAVASFTYPQKPL